MINNLIEGHEKRKKEAGESIDDFFDALNLKVATKEGETATDLRAFAGLGVFAGYFCDYDGVQETRDQEFTLCLSDNKFYICWPFPFLFSSRQSGASLAGMQFEELSRLMDALPAAVTKICRKIRKRTKGYALLARRVTELAEKLA